MKTMNHIRKASIILFTIMIGTSVWSQHNTRSSRRGENTRSNSESTQQNTRTQNNYPSDRTNNNYQTQNDRHQNNDQQSQTNYQHQKHYKNEAYHHQNEGHGHHGKSHHYNSDKHHYNHYQRNDNRYYSSLPAAHVNRFYYNNCEYYHAGNHFYQYHPAYGYTMVSSPYVYVSFLPQYYSVRILNGERYICSDGFVYLPFEEGYVMVPEPERPSFSFNIVIR